MNRPVFRYYGGKWRSAPWIISHFPDHQHYVELCGGAASVLIQKQPDDPIEAARRFWIGCQMSIRHLPYDSSGMSMVTKVMPRTPGCQLKRDHLHGIAERLIKVQIEQLPYADVIERYDAEHNLYYFDPPYLDEGKLYKHSFTREDHIKAAELFNKVKSKVIISGYNNSLYEELYVGWYREDKEFKINSEKKRTESIWMNYRHTVAKNKELF